MPHVSIFENSTSNAYRCQANYVGQDSVIQLSFFDLDDPDYLAYFK